MKKRILSLVLCAAMLLSMCLFLGAGVMDDTTADGSAESTETVVSTSGAPEFQSVGPFMTYFPGSSTVRKAPVLRTAAKGTSDGSSDAVEVDKTAKATDKKDADGNPIYQIELNAEAKSNIVTHTKACDIVLVLDRSGSMNFSLAGSDNNSKERVAALQTAVNAFLTTIQKSSPDSRVAIVSYASDVTIDSGTKTASGALIPVTADNTVNSALTQIVSGLSTRCDGGTQSGKGLQQAVNIFNSVATTDENYDNTRVTVLFTDGKPGNRSWGSYYGSAVDQGYDVAQQSVHWSVILKHAKGDTFSIESNVKEQNFFGQKFDWGQYGVSNYKDFKRGSAGQNNWKWTGCGSTVYSVGLGLKAAEGKDSEGCKINEYMYRVSSHRPDGSHVDNNRVNEWEQGTDSWEGLYTDDRTRNHENGYYLTTDNADKLKEIFTQIAQQTGEAVKDVTIRDEISKSFVPCKADGAPYQVGDTIVAGNYKGTVRQDNTHGTNGNYYIEWTNVTLTPEQINSDKVVTKPAETFQSTLYVKPRDGFLGGNNVPTNGENSGVYTADNNQIKPFPQPEVNVPIKLNAQNATKNIYYGNPAPTPEDLTQTADLAGWQKEYVNINYKVDTSTISNTDDGTYQVTMTVSPKYSGDNAKGTPATKETASVTSTVNVYKPEVTFKDCTTDYGVAPEYSTANFVNAEWKNSSGTSASEAEMTGEEPELTYAYAPVDRSFTKDTYVNVTVSANGTALPKGVVAFVHDDTCGFPGCIFDSTKGQFIVHINVFDLTIKKTAKDGTTIDADQTFVFKVTNTVTGKTMEVVITGDGQQTIKNLPMGSYTITEDTNWSWKYTPVDKNGVAEPSQTITAIGATTVTFENENKGTNWLTSLAEVINSWKTTLTQTTVWPKN